MDYALDCYQIEALRDFFKKFVMEWFLLGFPMECKKSAQQFNESYIVPLRADFEIAMHNDRIAPIGTPNVIPFAVVMPKHKISLSRQYEMYGFKDKQRFINYLKMDMLESSVGPGLGGPYIITNINCGKPAFGADPQKEYRNRLIAGEHRLQFEELLSVIKFMDSNQGMFPLKHQAAITGSYFISDDKTYVPYADFGNASGTVLNYTATENVFCPYRGVMTYERLYKG